MNNKYSSFIIAFFLINSLYSQTIKGNIQNDLKEPVSANFLIKNSENKNLISEFFRANDNGDFNFILKEKYTKVYFEVTAMGYQKITDSILNPEKNKTYQFQFVLKNTTTELEEVIIKKEKFKIQGDTTSFNPSFYKDGSEKKVEDLIKKLPGIEVGDNGTIKYKGKNVKSVQLDGDDLFGYNYSIGTRNISVDMVQQIQTIENYSENPLLKGIENTENVSINLKLKKGKFDLSANGNVGSGFDSNIEAKNEHNFNIIGISKKYKSFGNISYNNVGSNNSVDDYFSMTSNLDDLQNQDFLAKKNLLENIFSSNFDAQRANINNQLATSYNIIYRFSNKLSLKTNIYFSKDRITLLEENNVSFENENINYNDKTETIKKPLNKRVELKINYNITKLSLLEIESTIQKENINTTNDIVQNQNNNFNNTLITGNFFWKNSLKYTYKISKNNAFQFVSNASTNNIPQELKTEQTTFTFDGNLQQSEFRKKYFFNNFLLLGTSKKIKYAFVIGSIYENTPFSSKLLLNNVNVSNFQNNFDYQKTTFYSELALTYSINNLKFQPTLRLSDVKQNYKNNLNQFTNEKKSIIILPNLSISYNFNPKSILKISGNYEEKTPSEENLFTDLITQSNRIVKKNNFSLELQQNQNYSLNYRYNNLLTSFAINFAFFYDNKKNTFLSNIDIQDDYIIFNSFQSPTNIENYVLNFGVEKHISFLKTTIKHSSNFSVNNYKNTVNQGNLRNNQSLNYNAYFYINTAFRLPVNIQNKFNYGASNFISDNQNMNPNISVNNSTKLLIKPNRLWFFSINYDFYKPNTKNKDNFIFLDFELNYKPKKLKKINFILTGKNLLNNKFYTKNDNSDFQTILYRSSLMTRFYLLTLEFKL
ncbi:MAG: hypothetical protein ACOVNU_00550 [Candidatus Kapaibacteriota bacterium]